MECAADKASKFPNAKWAGSPALSSVQTEGELTYLHSRSTIPLGNCSFALSSILSFPRYSLFLSIISLATGTFALSSLPPLHVIDSGSAGSTLIAYKKGIVQDKIVVKQPFSIR